MTRGPIHYAAAFATALLLAACSPASSGNQQIPSSATVVDLAPQGSAEQTTTTASSTPTSSSQTATTNSSTTSTSTSSTPTTTSNPLPGGTSSIAALAEAGYLIGDRISLPALRTAAEAGAFTHDDSTEGVAFSADQVTTDLCDYLFGTADEVAAITGLPGAIHLAPLSGARLTADSSGNDDAAGALVVACVYADDASPQVVLQVGDGPPVDPDLPGRPIIVTGDSSADSGDEVQAVLSYAPDHTAPGIDARLARDWLTAALGRVSAAT